MELKGISHIGIAAKDPGKAREFFGRILEKLSEETVESQKTHTVMYNTQSQGRIELLEDAGGGPISKYRDKKGGGIHHLALRVASIDDALKFCQKNNIEVLSDSPKPGAHGSKTLFVHPKEAGGILVEFVEES